MSNSLPDSVAQEWSASIIQNDTKLIEHLGEQLADERQQFRTALKDLRSQNESEDVRLLVNALEEIASGKHLSLASAKIARDALKAKNFAGNSAQLNKTSGNGDKQATRKPDLDSAAVNERKRNEN